MRITSYVDTYKSMPERARVLALIHVMCKRGWSDVDIAKELACLDVRNLRGTPFTFTTLQQLRMKTFQRIEWECPEMVSAIQSVEAECSFEDRNGLGKSAMTVSVAKAHGHKIKQVKLIADREDLCGIPRVINNNPDLRDIVHLCLQKHFAMCASDLNKRLSGHDGELILEFMLNAERTVTSNFVKQFAPQLSREEK